MTEQEFNNLKPGDVIRDINAITEHPQDKEWEINFISGELLVVYNDNGSVNLLNKGDVMKYWELKK